MDIDKIQKVAGYMDQLRKIRTENLSETGNPVADQNLSVANMKLGDAIMHLHKAFEELLK